MKYIINKVAFVQLSVCIGVFALAMEVVVKEFALIDRGIGVGVYSVAMFLAFRKLALVFATIGRLVLAMPVSFALLESTIISEFTVSKFALRRRKKILVGFQYLLPSARIYVPLSCFLPFLKVPS